MDRSLYRTSNIIIANFSNNFNAVIEWYILFQRKEVVLIFKSVPNPMSNNNILQLVLLYLMTASCEQVANTPGEIHIIELTAPLPPNLAYE